MDKTVDSVNVGTPRQVRVGRETVLTSIWKSPVSGRLAVRPHNIDGDQQSDLKVHGGPYKAVYCYPHEHYEYWSGELPGAELVPGNFGENLTTTGLSEHEIQIGDQLRVGTAVLQVTQPRMPCFKLGIRFGRPDMVKRFWNASRPGIYLSIVQEGDVAAGDPIELLARAPNGITVSEVVALYKGEGKTPDRIARALAAPLFGSWKEGIRERL